MEFRSFITHLTLESVALQGEGKHVLGKRLPAYTLLYITKLQQIRMADRSGSRKEARQTH